MDLATKASMHFLKRPLDVALSLGLLLALLPLLSVLAILIVYDTPGPVFYCAPRMGKNGRLFTMFKFRSMVLDAEHLQGRVAHSNQRSQVLFKIYGDPRITRVGRWMRQYSLDELPQLWNVLRGDMSLVGPRPPLVSEVVHYSHTAWRRLTVPQGITGLWQIHSRNHPSFRRYLRCDDFYIAHWCLALDLRILLRTVGVVVRGTGV